MKSFKESFEVELAAQNARKKEESHNLSSMEKHYTNYDPIERNNLKSFTFDSSYINNYVWNKHLKKEKSFEGYEDKIKKLDYIMTKHKTPESMTVWSKSRHDPRELKNSEGIVHHPAYLSTSIHKSVPTSYLQDRNRIFNDKHPGKAIHHIWKIHIPESSHGAFIHDKDSINPKYKEFIIPRGSNLKHIHTDTQEDKNDVYHEHHMELMK